MMLEFQMIEVLERLARRLLTKLPAFRFGASAVADWWQRRETEHALRCLSDGDLADMGVARRDIREIARREVNMSGKR